MKKIKVFFTIFLTLFILFIVSPLAFAESYASPINVFTYCPEPVPDGNTQYAALHYKSGSSYLLCVGWDGSQGISCSFGIANNGNNLYASNTSSSNAGYVYYYFLSLDNLSISNVHSYYIAPNTNYQRIYEESYIIDAYQSYGLPCSSINSSNIGYALQVVWSKGTYDNISSIRSQVGGINNSMSMLVSYLSSINANQTTINSYLNNINNNLTLNNNKLDTVNSNLNKILSALNSEPSSKPDLSRLDEQAKANDDIDNELTKLQEQVTDDIFNSKFENDSISWIWSKVAEFSQGNAKVFSVILSILSLSLILFILNKGGNA